MIEKINPFVYMRRDSDMKLSKLDLKPQNKTINLKDEYQQFSTNQQEAFLRKNEHISSQISLYGE